MASCATPRPRKRRNSLDSLLTRRQNNSIATLKELISKIEADVAVLRNANDHHIEEQVLTLEDKITQMENSTKVDSQTLHSRMQDLETENEFLKAENAKMKSEKSKLKSDIHFIKSEVKQIKCLLQSNNSSENSTGSSTINGPAGRSDLSDHNGPSLTTRETDPPSEQSQYPEDTSIPLSNSFSGLMDDDPGDGDIVSSLLIRADGIDKQRQEFGTKLGHLCAPYPNVHLVNNDNITVENLYDSKHLKRKRIGLLVTNLKDTVFNRIRRVQ